MFYNKTIEDHLDKQIIELLKSNKCPLVVYRKLWHYLPHNSKPEIKNLKEEIIEHILNKAQRRIKVSKKSLKCLRDYCGSFENVSNLIKDFHEKKLPKCILISNRNNVLDLKIGQFVWYRFYLVKHGII